MKTFLLSAATAAALALSPAASKPAQAADLGDILVPLLGIAIAGAVISQAGDDDDNKASVQRVERRRTSTHARGKVLPGQCLRVSEGRRDRIVFPEYCLNRHGIRDGQLPNRCEQRVRTTRGPLDVYSARCMADAGWSLPRLPRHR